MVPHLGQEIAVNSVIRNTRDASLINSTIKICKTYVNPIEHLNTCKVRAQSKSINQINDSVAENVESSITMTDFQMNGSKWSWRNV